MKAMMLLMISNLRLIHQIDSILFQSLQIPYSKHLSNADPLFTDDAAIPMHHLLTTQPLFLSNNAKYIAQAHEPPPPSFPADF